MSVRSGLAVVVALVTTAALTSGPLAAQDTTWVIGSGRIGPITKTTTVADLRARFGAAAVVADRLDIGEGETEPGVVLFPDDSTRRAYLYWKDTASLADLSAVDIRDQGTRWRIAGGVGIGTPLARLEELNHGPFTFSGFDWDYGGRATFLGGLDSLAGPAISFGVGLWPTCREAVAAERYETVVGDKEVSSSDPVARDLCIVVDELWVSFR